MHCEGLLALSPSLCRRKACPATVPSPMVCADTTGPQPEGTITTHVEEVADARVEGVSAGLRLASLPGHRVASNLTGRLSGLEGVRRARPDGPAASPKI